MQNRNRHKNPGSQGVQLSLIVTPMLDMSFQILAFFIMTYHPSALEAHIPGNLAPENVAKKGKDNKPSDPSTSIPEEDLKPELDEALTVRVKAIGKGQEIGHYVEGFPSQFFVRHSTDTQDQLIAEVSSTVTVKQALEKLEAKLTDMLAKKAASKANLKLVADNDLRQQFVIRTHDICKKVGFVNVHFVPPPILKAKLQ
jgi:biopolymer transport protein ExbD